MLSISTLPEALAELEKQTGRVWTDSELFDLVTKYAIELHAAPPITARTTHQKFVISVGMVETFRSPPGHTLFAVLFPWQVGQLWLSGETLVTHTDRYNETEGEVKWFTEPVRVTRDQVRIKAATLQKMLAVWNQAQAGRWIENDKKPGSKKYQHGPEWMFPTEQSAPAQNTETPATVDSVGALAAPTNAGPAALNTRAMADCFAGLHWGGEHWIKKLGDKPLWLAECLVLNRGRGEGMRQWNPVLIGAYLVRKDHVEVKSVRAKFQTMTALKPWLDAWNTYAEEQFPTR